MIVLAVLLLGLAGLMLSGCERDRGACRAHGA